MMKNTGVIIPTTMGREHALIWNIEHLLKYLHDPFTVYVYNDLALPVTQRIERLINQSKRGDISYKVLNDNKEMHSTKVGAGGARYYLYEMAKRNHSLVISLDDDMQITKGWYSAIMEAMKRYPNHCVFTTLMETPSRKRTIAGVNIEMKNNQLKRKAIKNITHPFQYADWGPLGCLVFCREALQSKIKFPKVYTLDDEAFFLELKKWGISETVVATKGLAIHRPFQVADSKQRLPEKQKEAMQYLKKHYGIDFHL